MEEAQGAVVLCDGLNWSQYLLVDHLSPTQQEADPLLQPVGLLLQAAIAGQLLEELQRRRKRRSEGCWRSTENMGQKEICFTLVHW